MTWPAELWAEALAAISSRDTPFPEVLEVRLRASIDDQRREARLGNVPAGWNTSATAMAAAIQDIGESQGAVDNAVIENVRQEVARLLRAYPVTKIPPYDISGAADELATMLMYSPPAVAARDGLAEAISLAALAIVAAIQAGGGTGETGTRGRPAPAAALFKQETAEGTAPCDHPPEIDLSLYQSIPRVSVSNHQQVGEDVVHVRLTGAELDCLLAGLDVACSGEFAAALRTRLNDLRRALG
jgi:hypothetical protein